MRRNRRVGLVVIAGIAVLSACQETRTVGVQNECGVAVEVVADESPEFPDYLRFKHVEPGAVARVLTASEMFEDVFVWVRVPGDDGQGRMSSVPRSDTSKGVGGQSEFIVELSGGRCP